MILKPSSSPPSAGDPVLRSSTSENALRRTQSAVASQPVTSSTPSSVASLAQNQRDVTSEAKYKIPTVIIDQDRVSGTMAAALAMSLLGHVLFLKSQVPLPVMQLARMSDKQSEPRALKKRKELLGSIDTLASHLETTFTALSSALASKSKNQPGVVSSDSDTHGVGKTDQGLVYLTIVLGPSVNAAKARVVLAIDGLEIKVWGDREDSSESVFPANENENFSDYEEVTEESDDDTSEVDEEDSEEEEDESETCSESDAESEDEFQNEMNPNSDAESDSASEPPPSRSPSPERSTSGSPQPRVLSCKPTAELSVKTTIPTQATPHSRPLSYAEEQQQLRSAERLLSRTLASSCSEDESMSCELAPTQAHILLRAPRRFRHPAWVPRQTWTSSLDTILSQFLEDSGIRAPEIDTDGRKKVRRGVKTEGVFVGCTGASMKQKEVSGAVASENAVEEQDELIWWSWDGKLVGFSDW